MTLPPIFLSNAYDEAVRTGLITGIFSYLFAISGFLLAVLIIARLMREKRQPSATLAWLLIIVLMPYLGVPLYLLFGGRKLRRLAAHKHQLYPSSSDKPIQFEGWDEAHPLFKAAANPPTAGNRVTMLVTGEETYEALVREIENAEHCIYILAFILGRDEIGRRLVDLLARRAAEGVEVRLLLDALGCFWTRGYFVNPIRRAGGEVARFMPMVPLHPRWSAHLRNHRKLAIFDHRRAITGGHNLALEYMGPEPHLKRFQDFGALIDGPAVRELSEIFVADWNYATHRESGRQASLPEFSPQDEPEKPDPESGVVQVIASGPDVASDPLYEAILLLIQEASENITILTPYFVPDEVLFRSLLIKLHSGKEVTIVVPLKSNHRLPDLARGYYLRELKAAGANVLTYMPGMLHAKALLIDRKLAMFGSANMDLRSLLVNYEIGLFCYSRQDIERMYEWADSISKKCETFEPSPETEPGFFKSVAEDMSRLLAPIL